MSAHESGRRRARALAALDTTGLPRPPGRRPSREEIRQWIGGRLSSERSAEIDAHTAFDPELHAEWLALRLEALDDTTPRRRPAPSGPPRRRPGLVTALTVGAVLAAAVAILFVDT